MTIRWKAVTAAVITAVAAVAWAPPASALDAKLHEVTESMTLDSLAQPTLRTATAALQGTAQVGTPLCPQALIDFLIGAGLLGAPTSCTITAIGSDEVDLGTGAGTLSGSYAVVVNADNPVDAAELAVMTGTFSGGMQVLADPSTGTLLPLIAITGATLTPVDILGVPIPFVGVFLGLDPAAFGPANFGGVFRLPFAMSSKGKKEKPRRGRDAFYLGDDGKPFPVKKDELSLGLPTVRVEVTFAP